MKKHLTITLVGAALLVGTSYAATDAQTRADTKGDTYNWLHPKLGIVKIDRATNAMVVGKRQKSSSTESRQGAVAPSQREETERLGPRPARG